MNILQSNKLTITLNYADKADVWKLLQRVQKMVRSNSVCHQDEMGSSRYAFVVEDLSEENISSDFDFMQEPEMVEVIPVVEQINGKTCHVYVSKMNYDV